MALVVETGGDESNDLKVPKVPREETIGLKRRENPKHWFLRKGEEKGLWLEMVKRDFKDGGRINILGDQL